LILTPQHAKKFLRAISENITRYENSFGEIKGFEFENIPINFGPKGEA